MSTNPPPNPPGQPPPGYPPQGYSTGQQPQGYVPAAGYQQGYQPPPGYQQGAYPPQQPYGQPPVKKKTSPIVWILLGLGIFFVLVVLVIVGAGFFVMHKAKQAGFDPDLMKRNPALARVKMMAALTPNIEVLQVDDSRGLVTVRDKQSGKTFHVNLDDAKRGRFVFQEEGKQAVTITTTGDGNNGGVEIKSADGTMKLGGNQAVKVPAWIPDYPGSTPQGAFSATSDQSSEGSYLFKTNDSIQQVAKFYEDGLKSEGMKTTSTMSTSDGTTAGGMLTGEMEGKTVTVIVSTDTGQTNVSVTFRAKK